MVNKGFGLPGSPGMTTTLESSAGNAPLHNVLILDDEEIVLVALRETLQREGYNVVTCPNPVQALALLREQVFSAIISDQQMPMITGLEFLAQAKQIQPDATRILITAVLSLSTVIDAINKGEIYRFVVKPWLREDLLATVRNAVQRYELVCKNLVLQATTRAMNERLSKSNKGLEEQLAQVNRRNQELQRRLEVTAANLGQAAELSAKLLHWVHPPAAEAARHVFAICRAVGGNLNLSPEEQQIFELSAWLHDIGLIGLPSELVDRWLKFPETLNAEETARIERHPILSQELAGFTDEFETVGAVIRAHHERWDGSGYPDGLKAHEIPWLARLLAVAVFYAHCKLDRESTLEWMEQASGSAFDPAAVAAVSDVVARDYNT